MKIMDCRISERDIALLLSVELDSSEPFAREMIKWLGLPDGDLESFSSGLIRTGENGCSDIGFFCRIGSRDYAAIVETRFFSPRTSADYRQLSLLWMKYCSGKRFFRVKSALLAPEKYLTSIVWRRPVTYISYESVKQFFLRNGGSRGASLARLIGYVSCCER